MKYKFNIYCPYMFKAFRLEKIYSTHFDESFKDCSYRDIKEV